MSDRVDVEQHRQDVAELLAGLAPRPVELVPVSATLLGRVLAHDVTAPGPLPRFRNSQMDGFAVRAADVAGASADAPVDLPVAGEVAAAPGEPAPLAPGTAVRIMTGAPVPTGADAVIPVEDTDARTFNRPTAADRVRIVRSRAAGEYVREAGSDVAPGDLVLPADTVLAPHHVAAAAACGLGGLPVHAPVRVAILSTGSELVAPGEPAGPGQVWDANTAALAAAVTDAGGTVVTTGRTGDDPAALRAALAAASAAGAELVITSGGVSQGAYEVVKEALAGVTFRSVAMQPGGPQGLGVVDGMPVLTFPGNPVSAQVSFVVLVRDALRSLGGLPPVPRLGATLAQAVVSPASRRQLLRGRLRPSAEVVPSSDGGTTSAGHERRDSDLVGRGHYLVEVVGGAGSHLVASMAAADVLIDVPAEVTGLEPGDQVTVWPLHSERWGR
ncbi:gephyrin-like molybdotransferase Glp [Antribacter gilvus]|uniref:molybdopterin molybdotransferase MoeA n=1 Tax=Antribacter gilvus TaxID=2304675 RepID=UPI00197FA24B|nr:gephyrin-like molybdotransferase Glp [Antribacter gilvus]